MSDKGYDQELEQKVEEIYKAKSTPPEPSAWKLEMDDISERYKNGENVSAEEVHAVLEKIEKDKIRNGLIMAEQKPAIDKVFGEAHLSDLTESLQIKELADHLSVERQNENVLVEKILTDQLAATHSLSMRILSQICTSDEIEMSVFNDSVRASEKLMRLSHRTADLLHKYRTGGKQLMTVQHQYIQVNNSAKEPNIKTITDMGGGGDKLIDETTPCINDLLVKKNAEKVRS